MQKLNAKAQNEAVIAEMFDRIAPRYDFLNRLLSFRQDQRWRKELVRVLPTVSNGSLLDVATGTGDVLLQIACSSKQFSKLHGVDISSKMLNIAQQKAKKKGINVNFELMSAEDLKFLDQSFEAVTISFGLRNVVDKKKGLEEFYRVLKPEGRLVILEFFSPKSNFFAPLYSFYFKQILPKIGAILSDRSAYSYLPASVDAFYSSDELRTILISCGFKKVSLKKFLFGNCLLICADK